MSRLKFRRKEKKYTEVYNTIIFKNKNVELTGLYTIIQACIDLEINTAGTENEFIITKNGIRSFTGYSEKKFDRIWLELKEAGYLKQYKYRNLEVSGKWLYEYELLDEPDLTTYHSLKIQDDGSIVPNIPSNKLEKMKKEQEERTDEIVSEKVAPKNRRVESSPLFLRGWEKGGFNNTSLNKVCMYVCKAQENYSLTNKNKEYIESIKEKIEFDLFEQIIVDAKNKNKTFAYVKGTIDKSIESNIFTLDAFLENRKSFTGDKNSKVKSNVKGSTKAKTVNTKIHNFSGSDNFTKYTPEELEKILLENQKNKSNNPSEDLYNAVINNNNFNELNVYSKTLVLEYAQNNNLLIPSNWMK